MPTEAHDHPALTADVVMFAVGEAELRVLLIQRGRPPFEGAWAFPGGFVHVGESPRDAACRELEEETGIRDVHLEQLRAFGDPSRDPRGHTVTVAYLAVVAANAAPQGAAASDAAQARWWSIDALPSLAFDHTKILTYALRKLRSKLACARPELASHDTLPAELSLGDLRAAYRAITAKLESNRDCRQI
jgi:8-oxo-dGTP diphosphatase